MYVKFPFLNNKCCDLIRKELAFILSKSFPHIDFRYSFINNFTIQGLLKHKERLPDDLSSGIVYLYECGTCGATYSTQGRLKSALELELLSILESPLEQEGCWLDLHSQLSEITQRHVIQVGLWKILSVLDLLVTTYF